MKNQKQKKEVNIFLALILCLLIVAGVSYGLNQLKSSFENSQKVMAETLSSLPNDIKQNQTSEIINNGYLNDGSFYSAK